MIELVGLYAATISAFGLAIFLSFRMCRSAVDQVLSARRLQALFDSGRPIHVEKGLYHADILWFSSRLWFPRKVNGRLGWLKKVEVVKVPFREAVRRTFDEFTVTLTRPVGSETEVTFVLHPETAALLARGRIPAATD